MNGVFLQDLFSNLLIAMLVLVMLTMRLAGTSEPLHDASEQCTEGEATVGTWLAFASDAAAGSSPAGRILAIAELERSGDTARFAWHGRADAPRRVRVLAGGCEMACRECQPNEKEVTIERMNGKRVSIDPCTTQCSIR